MQFSQFLAAAPQGAPSITRRVRFRALRPGTVDAPIEVEAALAPLSEDDREVLRVDAAAALARRFPSQPIPPGVQADEEAYRRLFACLRDPDKPTAHFFASVDEVRGALVLATVRDLLDELDAFEAEEFPPVIDDAAMAALEKEAAGKSLSALLSGSGSSPAGRRALRGFLARVSRTLI